MCGTQRDSLTLPNNQISHLCALQADLRHPHCQGKSYTGSESIFSRAVLDTSVVLCNVIQRTGLWMFIRMICPSEAGGNSSEV